MGKDIKAIIKFLDSYLTQTGRPSIDAVEANALLAKAGLLQDSVARKGKPIRELLRKGHLPHAFQSGGKGSGWTIPHSSKRITTTSNFPTINNPTKHVVATNIEPKVSPTVKITELKTQLEAARLKYKPNIVKYLLIAEAPPDSVERFFYYENVFQHDYLFLGVTQALYPDLKDEFIASGRNCEIKESILLKLKADGFYLLDLSELPLSLLKGDLSSQLPSLIEKIKVVSNEQTKIILIKTTVFDTTYLHLQKEGFENVINVRIPFPGQGGQKLFQTKFHEALELAKHH